MAVPGAAYGCETASSPQPITGQATPVGQSAVMSGSSAFAHAGSAASPVPVHSASLSGGSVP